MQVSVTTVELSIAVMIYFTLTLELHEKPSF